MPEKYQIFFTIVILAIEKNIFHPDILVVLLLLALAKLLIDE
jgi:hypothetical protein